MKTITATAKILLLAAIITGSQGVFAQSQPAKEEKKEYRIKLVKDENGKKEVIDRSFSSKEEMEAYLKDNNMDLPAVDESGKKTICEEKIIEKNCGKKCDKNVKKIYIIEKEESSNGGTELEIKTTDLDPQERAALIQELMSIKGAKVEVKRTHTVTKEIMVEKEAAKTSAPPALIENINPAPVANLQLYPNPNNGQFHVAFKTDKPSDITLRMLDMNGKQVYLQQIKNHSGSFDKDIALTPALAKGQYLLEAEANGQKTTTQVVVQ